jgi:hypothetical protein
MELTTPHKSVEAARFLADSSLDWDDHCYSE